MAVTLWAIAGAMSKIAPGDFFEGLCKADLTKPDLNLETEVRRIRELLERSQFAPALTLARALLPRVPDNRDVLYMTAIALRYLEHVPEALNVLQRLEAAHPDYPRLYQERGHCYMALRAATPAIEAFERAVKLSPSLIASWRALETLYHSTGKTAEAQNAAGQLATLAKLPAEIVTAYSMYADNELTDAERLLRRYLLGHGAQAEGMRLLAQIGLKMHAPEEAEVLLEKVVAFAPEYDAARYDYATVLLKRHKHAQARDQLNALLQKEPNNPAYRGLLAAVYAGFGDYGKALPLYLELLKDTPGDAELQLTVAHALKTIGRTDEAIAAYRAAAAARSRFGEAYWSLANLKTYRFSEAEVARMRLDENAPDIKIEDRYNLCFALGKAYEDMGAYAESFAYYERGNALKRAEVGYNPALLERSMRMQMSLCTREFFAARAGSGCQDPLPDGVPYGSPIFIVGLPRSGSTLLEQILASHSQVEGTMELAHVPRLVQDLQGPAAGAASRYPGILAELTPADFKRLGEEYMTVTRRYRTGKAFFIDKMPNNFRHIALIHLMLPNAKIIDARREPLACCFSNYKQLFAAGQPFTYSIEDIARYYRLNLEVMAHWDETLPRKILHVQHESVVEDLETNVHRLLNFCGLEFEPACLDFHKTRRDIHSASSEQVRQPLNRQGLDQWRHFEPWLGPLKAALAG
jgi:tetratricopeptide (TPR) repeat protein